MIGVIGVIGVMRGKRAVATSVPDVSPWVPERAVTARATEEVLRRNLTRARTGRLVRKFQLSLLLYLGLVNG